MIFFSHFVQVKFPKDTLKNMAQKVSRPLKRKSNMLWTTLTCGVRMIPTIQNNIMATEKQIAYWKSMEGVRKVNNGQFKKGQVPWNWKGSSVSYRALHDWVRYHLGKP